MNPNVKKWLISSAVTFLSAFILNASVQIAQLGTVELNATFLVGVLLVAVRGGIKAVFEGGAYLGKALGRKN